MPLSRELITGAAISYIERHGVERLSMRHLAGEIGCGTMSLYSYVKNRDDLTRAIVSELITRSRLPEIATHDFATWQQLARDLCSAYRDLAFAYPRSHELLGLAPYEVEPVASHVQGLLAAMERTGLTAERAAEVFSALDAYLTGYFAVSVRSAMEDQHPASERDRALQRLRAPELFERGLEVFVLGFEQEFSRRDSA